MSRVKKGAACFFMVHLIACVYIVDISKARPRLERKASVVPFSGVDLFIAREPTQSERTLTIQGKSESCRVIVPRQRLVA